MIRLFITVAILVFAAVGLASEQASAQVVPLSDEHIQRIRDNCRAATRTLTRVRTNDTLVRVNRGQLYDLISTKLMARLNSRLAINKLDASNLVSVTANFDETLSTFRLRYESYEDQLSRTIRTDCQDRPEQFYRNLQKTRELRLTVHNSVTDLNQYIDDYRDEFESFYTNFLEPEITGDKR